MSENPQNAQTPISSFSLSQLIEVMCTCPEVLTSFAEDSVRMHQGLQPSDGPCSTCGNKSCPVKQLDPSNSNN